ncbi:type II CRISPR-associated endonuclease Cas1 [Helicobacter sp. 11S02596-1]|uniref:type II CRISPR-associated endonuclease Cas1 n=1 Tax=Helicobacter sp. 11S02596-1 TaxID=1476194 RepID=UPI000BA6F4DA|nr:type II CRISPR-associated endonuclease Cas1 [Helicobacter sp. 11S02596-1]PAF42350.1 hypothetical protein BJI48_06980 [Helicobacter sp. 11S02596-1]
MAGFDEAYRCIFIGNPAKLSLKNNLFCITQENKDITFPLRDILLVISESKHVSITTSLLSKLADNKIAFFTCDDSHTPNGIFTPYLGYYKTSEMLQNQIAFSKQNKAILWQQIIKQKLYNQAMLATAFCPKRGQKILELSKAVVLNDAKNFESQGAILYFQALFGNKFSRKDCNPINAALNYAYAIIRGCVARSLVSSGLLPAFGIFHKNQFNAFNLADDMLEPYRVFADSLVCLMVEKQELIEGFQRKHRQNLVGVLNAKIACKDRHYPMYRAITRSVQSLANVLRGFENQLVLPVFIKENSDGREVYENFSDV